MFKFLRKYNKWILAVGGTLLMIVFLVPQAIQTLSQRAALGSVVWATVGDDDDELSPSDREQASNEVEVLLSLGRVDPSLPVTDNPEHWFLLVREAEQMGLLGANPRDVLPTETLQALYTLAGRSGGIVDEALSKRFAIERMRLMYQNTGKLSDARMRQNAAKQFHAVDARLVMLEASAENDLPEPTESALQAQFEAYRDVAPGEGDQGFGYRLPDRFKIEWLRVSTESVEEMVLASGAINPVDLYKFWQREQVDRGLPPFTAGADIPEIVRAGLIDSLTEAKQKEVERFITEQLYTARRGLRVEEAYYVLPADWAERNIDLETLGTKVQAEFPGLPLPVYGAIGDRWLIVDDLVDIEAISAAESILFGGTPKRMQEMVGAAKEFGGGDPAVVVQANVVGPVLHDRTDDSIVLFRLTAVDPKRPPTSLDEVRPRVVEDLKRKADYDRLVAQIDDVERTAVNDGLVALALQRGVPMLRGDRIALQNMGLVNFFLQQGPGQAIPDTPSSLPVLGEHIPTLERIVERALALPIDKPVLEVPRAERTFVLAVDDQMVVTVVEITRQYPMTKEQFTQLVSAGALQRLMLTKELAKEEYAAADVFGYDALAARHNFKLVRSRSDEEDAAAAGDATTTTVSAE